MNIFLEKIYYFYIQIVYNFVQYKIQPKRYWRIACRIACFFTALCFNWLNYTIISITAYCLTDFRSRWQDISKLRLKTALALAVNVVSKLYMWTWRQGRWRSWRWRGNTWTGTTSGSSSSHKLIQNSQLTTQLRILFDNYTHFCLQVAYLPL